MLGFVTGHNQLVLSKRPQIFEVLLITENQKTLI